MNSRLYNIINYQSKNAEQLIKEKYNAAFMNNTKWVKMINILVYQFDSIFLNYKLIYDEIIEGALFDIADMEPYFIEPIKYKEVEWINFPTKYKIWINVNNRKAGMKEYSQDIKSIKEALENIGKFDLEMYPENLRLYGYK